MNVEAIRQEFEAFCGTEQYNKFIAVFQSFSRQKQTLRFWQEEQWSAFCKQRQHPVADCDAFPTLTRIFDICHLHRVALQPDSVPVVYGMVSFEPQYIYARDTEFPLDRSVVYGGCVVEDTKVAKVMYCPECRRAQQAWSAENVLPDVETCRRRL